MKQNTFMIALISLKEKLHKLYQDKSKLITPLIRGLLAFAVLYVTARMLPYNPMVNRPLVYAGLGLLQAFLPFSFLYYIVSAFILCNLWKVSFDIFAAFVIFIIICAIGYFRIDGHYSYIAVIVPVLFYLKLGVAVPAVFAIAYSMEALFPVAAGVIIYYLCQNLQEAYALLSSTDNSSVGVGLQHVVTEITADREFLVMLAGVFVTILITCTIRRFFHERAWQFASLLGNILMAFMVLAGRMYLEIEIPVWLVLAEALSGILLCALVEFYRGIGDVTRIEKTVFEDDEYIYYVKAVPKMRVTESDPNVKNINAAVREETVVQEEDPAGEDKDTLDDMAAVSEEGQSSEHDPETENMDRRNPVTEDSDIEAYDVEAYDVEAEEEFELENAVQDEDSEEIRD